MNGVRAPSSGVRVPLCDVMSVSQYPAAGDGGQCRVRVGVSVGWLLLLLLLLLLLVVVVASMEPENYDASFGAVEARVQSVDM